MASVAHPSAYDIDEMLGRMHTSATQQPVSRDAFRGPVVSADRNPHKYTFTDPLGYGIPDPLDTQYIPDDAMNGWKVRSAPMYTAPRIIPGVVQPGVFMARTFPVLGGNEQLAINPVRPGDLVDFKPIIVPAPRVGPF